MKVYQNLSNDVFLTDAGNFNLSSNFSKIKKWKGLVNLINPELNCINFMDFLWIVNGNRPIL